MNVTSHCISQCVTLVVIIHCQPARRLLMLARVHGVILVTILYDDESDMWLLSTVVCHHCQLPVVRIVPVDE